MNDFSTLCDLLVFQASKHSNEKALNYKENGVFKSFSNQEFLEKAFHFACALREIGFKKGQTFANYSYQNPIWLIVDLGAILAGAITVPIFENISKENLFYEIADADVKIIFTDNADFVEENFAKEQKLKIISQGFKKENTTSFEDLISLGKKASDEKKYSLESFLKECAPGDLATIIYTSGSTGRPKGVELTHQNLVSQIKDSGEFFPLTTNDVVLSFLPLAHIFERMVMMFYISRGVTVYFADDVKNVGNLLKEVSPTLMTTVPRLLEKVYAKICDGIESSFFIKRKLGQKALKRALEKDVNSPDSFLDKIFDLLVYKKFRKALGGRMQMIICGGAALSLDLQKFYHNIKVTIYCGYGLTETSPVLAVNSFNNNKIGTVGKKFPSVELKIAQDGELLAKGLNVMVGYHKQAQKTAENFVDGWFKTGDLAEIDEEGFVTIKGRKKELFKNANGKYISPTPIEQKLVQELGFLLGAVVIAEGRKFTSALLFPEFDLLKKLKQKFAFDGSDEEFLKSEKLREFVSQKIVQINKDLNHWEEVQKFHIVTQQISIESGEITPSMKLKRNVLEEKYKEVIEKFYR
jgi:long-chain acyl-CoA synthetase